MAAIGAGFSAAGFFHLLTHGLFKALLFLGAGAVIHAVGSNDLSKMGGLARKMPQTTIVFLVGTLSLAGIPFFGGFLSKEEILGAVIARDLAGPFLLLIVVAFLTAFYMFRVVFLAFFAPSRVPATHAQLATRPVHGAQASDPIAAEGVMVHDEPGPHSAHLHDPPPSMALPLWVLTVLSMGVGVYFTFVPPEAEFESPNWLTPAAVTAAFAGILLAWLTYQRRSLDADRLASGFAPIRHAALAKFWIDDVFVAIYERVILGISAVVGWVDRYLVDGLLNALSAWTLTAGDDLRSIQTGRAQDYVYGIAVGLLAIILWMNLRG
jgi:NADH-quinone oxidoreductase subunit L